MHFALSSTQQVVLIHEEQQPGEFSTTVTSENNSPFEMVLVDSPTFEQLGESIEFQKAEGSLTATVKSEGEAWYLILRADPPTEVNVVTLASAPAPTSAPAPAPAPAPAGNVTPAAGPVARFGPGIQAAAPKSSGVNWMLIVAIAIIVLIVGYFVYTHFLAPAPRDITNKLRNL